MVVRVGSTPSGGADRAQQRLADLVTDDFHEGTERRLDVGGVVAPAVGAKELRQGGSMRERQSRDTGVVGLFHPQWFHVTFPLPVGPAPP